MDEIVGQKIAMERAMKTPEVNCNNERDWHPGLPKPGWTSAFAGALRMLFVVESFLFLANRYRSQHSNLRRLVN
jgi:hypothetical protein